MKTVIEATKTGSIVEPKHEIEQVCSECQDPISAVEESSGTCTNCGATWEPLQSVSIWVTTLPSAGAKSWGAK
jgi:hypothetical protein